MSLALTAAMAAPAYAQIPASTLPVADRGGEPTEMDYERMVNSMYKVELRSLAINALNLTTEETEDFTPIYMEYMKYKNGLADRRTDLVQGYRDEMAEDDTAEDEREETADFIENYWEVDIADMNLRKDYFDKLEDKIGYAKALQFFELEKMFQNRYNRAILAKNAPSLYMLIPEQSYAYEREVNDFRNWKKVNIDGNVSLDHNYTSTGLTKLMTAAEAMAMSEGINVPNFKNKKKMVMDKADMITKNWKSLKHADYAREAFTATAGVLKEIAMDSRFVVRQDWINKLEMQAKAIKPSVKLTDQASEVRAFFGTAETIVNDLVEQANRTADRK